MFHVKTVCGICLSGRAKTGDNLGCPLAEVAYKTAELFSRLLQTQQNQNLAFTFFQRLQRLAD